MEIDSENLLIDWLNQNNFTTYSNRSSLLLHTKNKFTTKGLRYKPDLLVHTKSHGWCAIEIKPAYNRRNIGDGGKIINYWEDYTKGLTKYFVNGQEIKIDFFLIATGYSLNGKLLGDDTELIYQDYPRHPLSEYIKSREYVRGIFDEFRRKKQRGEIPEESAGWGAVLSTCLNRDSRNKPAFFTQRYLFNNFKRRPEIYLSFMEVQ